MNDGVRNVVLWMSTLFQKVDEYVKDPFSGRKKKTICGDEEHLTHAFAELQQFEAMTCVIA